MSSIEGQFDTAKLPIGISDFKEVIEEGYQYVDKTLLIEELKRTNGKVLLLPRPRRFGKTLNLSMLRYFFEKSETSNAHLFHKTLIWRNEQFHKFQGIYPVIFLTFKNVKVRDWPGAYERMQLVIADEFKRHRYLLEALDIYDRKEYEAILAKEASKAQCEESLFFLTRLLRKHYKKKVIVLIDEYDAPIHAAYNNGYYKEMIDFMRSLLTAVLKDNSYLERAVLTGILRAAKEGIFSGLNNLRVYTLLQEKFADKFGFTTSEVDVLLAHTHLTRKNESIKDWYNGYTFGKTTIYNPWSLLECIDHKGVVDPYWANTSDNELVRRLIAQADEAVKSELELLLSDKPIVKEIDEKALWSLLLFAGYATFNSLRKKAGKTFCSLILPNKEIKFLYRNLISSIFDESLGGSRIQNLKESLLAADSERFEEMMQDFVLKSMSAFDIPENEPEKSYHLFVLGLLVTFSDLFEVKSNHESGYGRYDILLIPHDKKNWGLILEFKKVSARETLADDAKKALKQIENKEYVHELGARGIKKKAAFGIACKGKKILVNSKILN